MSQVNWLVSHLEFPCEVEAQIRYNSPMVPVNIQENDGDYEIYFQTPQIAITPGQSIVFYQDDVVLGGGIIERKIGADE